MYRVLIFISLLALALAGKKPQHQSALQHQHFRSENVEALSSQAKQRFKSKTHGGSKCNTIKSSTSKYDEDTICFDVSDFGSPIFEGTEEQKWGFIKWLYRKSDDSAQRFIKDQGAWVVSKLDGHLKGANPIDCQALGSTAFDQRFAFIPARNKAIRAGKRFLERSSGKTFEDDSCLTEIRKKFAEEPKPKKLELVNKDYCLSGKAEVWGNPDKSCPSKCEGKVEYPDGNCNCKSPCETNPSVNLGDKHTCDGALATVIPEKSSASNRCS